MRLRLAVPAAVILMAIAVPALSADYVYFAEERLACTMAPTAYDGQVFGVFVLLEEEDAATGVTFRLDTDRFGPDNVDSVTPASGVTIDGGDIFSGITLSFSSAELAHEPVLTVTLSGHANTGYVWTRGIKVHRGAGAKDADDQITVAYPSDCFGATPRWELPDTAEALVGGTSMVTFRAGLSTVGAPDSDIRVVDALGWVVESEPINVYAVCGWCPWSWTTISLPVNVPAGTANETLNVVTVEMHSLGGVVDEKSIVLRATDALVTEPTTWGRLKALYE